MLFGQCYVMAQKNASIQKSNYLISFPSNSLQHLIVGKLRSIEFFFK